MLDIKELSIKYGVSDKTRAINSVSFSASAGEKIAIAGANGAGKSTLILALCGVIEKMSGEAVVCGISLERKHLAELRRKVGVVFQNPDDQIFMPTVYEDIAFGPRSYGTDEREIQERIDGVLTLLGIPYLKDRLSHKLSGGEKRLVTLAGVLIMEPELLLLDEPTTFLDPRAKRRFIEILKGLPQTILIATHDLDVAAELCGRAIVLKEGAVFADGPAREILENAQLLDKSGL